MNIRNCCVAVLSAMLIAAGGYAARAADLSLGIDPMVLEFSAPYGGEARASVAVTNQGSADEVVYANPVDWRTSQNGDVVFERPGTERSHSLTNSLSVVPATFVLHAGETRSIEVKLRMPGTQQGATALWGGFVVRASASGSNATGATPGGTILVYDTIGTPRRHLGISTLSIRRDSSGSAQVVAHLLNDGETYVRPSVRIVVERGETVVRDRSIPCNVIFAGGQRILTAPLEGLAPGAYHVHLLLRYGGDSIVDGVTDARLR